MSMFEHVTSKAPDARDQGAMTPSSVASQIIEAQVRHLNPYFQASAIIGGQASQLFPRALLKTFINEKHDNDATMVDGANTNEVATMKPQLKFILATMLSDMQKRLEDILTANSVKINEPKVIYDRVARFYDATMSSIVEARTARLVNDRIPILSTDLHPDNRALMERFPPRTACHVMDILTVYRIEQSEWLNHRCEDINEVSGVTKEDMKLSLLLQVLLEIGLIAETDLKLSPIKTNNSKHSSGPPGAFFSPARQECYSFLTSCLDEIVDNEQSIHYSNFIMPEHIVEVVRQICTNNLWLHGFHMLIRVMGLDPSEHEFPVSLDQFELTQIDNEIRKTENVLFDQTFRNRHATYRRNCIRIKKIFDQLSGRTCFLPTTLADEAVILLTNNRLHLAAVHVCLQKLQITSNLQNVVKSQSNGNNKQETPPETLNVDNLDKVIVTTSNIDVGPSSAGDTCAEELRTMGMVATKAAIDIEAAADDKQSDFFDWTMLSGTLGWPTTLVSLLESLSKSTPGFISKSQMIEFARQSRDILQGSTSSQHQPGRTTIIARSDPHHGHNRGSDVLVSFEVFTEVMTGLKLSISRLHSQLLWSLIVYAYNNERSRLYLPPAFVASEVTKVIFQPTHNVTRELVDLTSSSRRLRGLLIQDVLPLEFRGVMTFSMFKEFLTRIEVQPEKRGILNIWKDIPKTEHNITPLLPDEFFRLPTGSADDPIQICNRSVKFFRLGLDIHGLDPTVGCVVSIHQLAQELPAILMSGLWPEALKNLVSLNLNITAESEALKRSIASQPAGARNRYGLIKAGHVPSILGSLDAHGMPLQQLYDVVQKMQLQLANKDLRRMFNVMDLNQDKTLDEREFFTGFTVLFGNFVPNLVIDSVNINSAAQVRSLFNTICLTVFVFLFIGMSFNAFTAGNTAGAAIQSLLALIAAFSYQTTSANQEEVVQKKMIHRMEKILGEGLEKRLNKHREHNQNQSQHLALRRASALESHLGSPPPKIRYVIPSRFIPDQTDADRMLTFYRGDYVRIEPVGADGKLNTNFNWKILPPLSSGLGLSFNTKTGVIMGQITRDILEKGHTADLWNVGIANHLQMSYLVACSNSFGVSICRITFQVLTEA